MQTAKKLALAMMKKLPEKATWDDIMHEIYIRKKIDVGMKAADEGRVISRKDVKKHFLKKWTRIE